MLKYFSIEILYYAKFQASIGYVMLHAYTSVLINCNTLNNFARVPINEIRF